MSTALKYLLAILVIVITGLAAYNAFGPRAEAPVIDGATQNVTLSGTYECLPHRVTSGPQTDECAFGLKTDEGEHYAVNFGASASAMERFQAGEHITAEGFVVPRMALSDSQWAKYDMEGMFTITRLIEPAPVGVSNSAPGKPTFIWTYTAFEAADIPQTKVGLIATYPDGTRRTKDIDTIEGNCNAHPSPDSDVYAQSEMIICYYAGFGRYYKVVDIGSGVFAVQRREFEEASPDYNPPIADFETIAEFQYSGQSSKKESVLPETFDGVISSISSGAAIDIKAHLTDGSQKLVTMSTLNCSFTPKINKLFRFTGVRFDANTNQYSCSQAQEISFSGSDQ